MSAKDAVKHDDGRDDPNNPVVPFRMSDRLMLYGNELKVNIILWTTILIAGLVSAGMALRFL